MVAARDTGVRDDRAGRQTERARCKRPVDDVDRTRVPRCRTVRAVLDSTGRIASIPVCIIAIIAEFTMKIFASKTS